MPTVRVGVTSKDGGLASLSPPYGAAAGHRSGIPSGGLGALAEIAGPEIVGAEVGQLAFQALDVQPQRPALAEQQHRAAAGRLAGMKLDPDQFQRAVSPDNVCSQSSRFMPTSSRFSPCRQMMSEVCTRASCTCVEITARSSASSAINLSWAVTACTYHLRVF